MNFSCALLLILGGFVVTRPHMTGVVSLWVPKVGEELNLSFLHMTYKDNNIPWTPTQLDLQAGDWTIVEE